MADVRALGVTERCAVLAGVGPVRSLRMYEFLSTKVPGLFVPEAVGRRLRGVQPDRVAEEGLRICVETIHEILAVPGVSGVHVMAVGNEQAVPEIARRAGIGPSADPVVGASEQKGSGHAG
jgi:methylenetetrahydrofolate reductase (NADPH)